MHEAAFSHFNPLARVFMLGIPPHTFSPHNFQDLKQAFLLTTP